MEEHFAIVSPEEAKAALNNADNLFLDIRDPASFQQNHILKAIHIHEGNLEEFVSSHEKSTPLYVYCYHGNSSQSAAEYLGRQGFTHVYSIAGGFAECEKMLPTKLNQEA